MSGAEKWMAPGWGGVLPAFAGYMKPPEKTREDLESELEAWKSQASLARQTVLDVSVALSKVSRESSDLEEKLRLAELRELKLTKELVDVNEKHQAELAALKERVEELEAKTKEPPR